MGGNGSTYRELHVLTRRAGEEPRLLFQVEDFDGVDDTGIEVGVVSRESMLAKSSSDNSRKLSTLRDNNRNFRNYFKFEFEMVERSSLIVVVHFQN